VRVGHSAGRGLGQRTDVVVVGRVEGGGGRAGLRGAIHRGGVQLDQLAVLGAATVGDEQHVQRRERERGHPQDRGEGGERLREPAPRQATQGVVAWGAGDA
jgi:hypothetical protein